MGSIAQNIYLRYLLGWVGWRRRRLRRIERIAPSPPGHLLSRFRELVGKLTEEFWCLDQTAGVPSILCNRARLDCRGGHELCTPIRRAKTNIYQPQDCYSSRTACPKDTRPRSHHSLGKSKSQSCQRGKIPEYRNHGRRGYSPIGQCIPKFPEAMLGPIHLLQQRMQIVSFPVHTRITLAFVFVREPSHGHCPPNRNSNRVVILLRYSDLRICTEIPRFHRTLLSKLVSAQSRPHRIHNLSDGVCLFANKFS